MLRFGASKGFLCRKIKYHLMENREEDWKETVKKRQNKMEAWRLSCLSIEELLCLQLLGYSPRQLYEDIESERYSLKETASMSIRELDKAKRILDRQAKAGVITIPYHDKSYPHHFRNLCRDAPPYDTQNELNSGNQFLLDYNLALPIRLGQEVTLDLDNKIVIA